MADWTSLEVTWRTTLSPPPDGTIYLPPGKPQFDRIVVRTAADAEFLAKSIARPGHGGEGGVATGTLYQKLGGDDASASVSYREATLRDRFRLKPMLFVQLAVVMLTLFGALIEAWAGFLATQADPATAFAARTAAIVVLVAFVGALWKFYEDFKLD